jgi:RNA polymerase sigma factor (sigma-70 family)
VPSVALPETAVTHDPFAEADTRRLVYAALAELPRRQRAVVVSRFFNDLTEAQTASLLGCSRGTVKSQTAKALARLRASSMLGGLLAPEVSRDRG